MPTYDTLIHGGRIIDGTGNPWFYGDVAIKGQRIAAVTPGGVIPIDQVAHSIQANGLVVSPGFIDIQSHSIAPLMRDGRSLSKITQGVTTEIMGELWTPAPFGGRIKNPIGFKVYADMLPDWVKKAMSWNRFGQWLDAMMDHGVSPNVGSFLGGGTLRNFVKGLDMGTPSAEEMKTMRRLMAEAMEDGAFGVSSALIYPPDAYTDTDAWVDICDVVGRYNGLYITHVRSEADGIFSAFEEAFEIGRRANVPVEIYHLKAAGRRNWPKMPQAIALIEQARASGLDVTADMYPYEASGTGLTSVLPPWAEANGALFDNLMNPRTREEIREAALNPVGGWEAMADLNGVDGVMPIGFQQPENKQYAGMRLNEIADDMGMDWIEAVFQLLLSERQRISTIYFSMSEENIRDQLRLDWIKISTDAGGLDPEWAETLGPVHPRAYGTYPRVLNKYVREEQVITLEDCVRKMSSAVADRLGLRNRGLLKEGMQADVVVFNPKTIGDNATFKDPHRLSQGVRDVWVNGVRVVDNAVHTGNKPGQIVRGSG